GFNLSHYNSKTQQLSLSSGQSFTLYPNDIRGGTFTIKYHRLKDVIIKASPNGFTPYQIIFKDGHTEYLSNQGYEIKSCSEEGYCVNFDYNNVQPYPEITSITSDSGSVLYKFIWSSSHYLQRLDVLPQSSSSSSYYFDYDGQTDELNQITMPDDGKINITFFTSGYCEGHTGLIGELSFPTGLTIKYNYLLDGLIYPPLANAPIRSVAAISSQTLLPDGTHNESQAYTTTYSYGGNQANNYLGYGVSGSFNLSEDALYLANNDYKYQTIVTEPEGTETIQDYNKFHLLTSQARQDDKGNPLSKIYYCYGGNIGYCKGTQHIIDPPDKPESASCDAYSLPSKVTTELYTLGQSDSCRQKIIQASYDNYGNILRSVDAMGTEKDYQYQPLGALKAGQLKNMPLSDQDFVKYIQKLTIKPYKEVTDTTLSQPILFMYTNFDYAPVTVHSIDIQKLISKGVGYNDGSDHLYTHQSWKYNDAKDNQELLLEDQQGLPLSTSLSLVKDNSIKDSENITEDYDYKVLSSGNLQYSSTLENPLITSRNVVNNATGLKIEQISPNGSYVKYNYDSMRRVSSKELCDTKGQSISKERYNYYYVGSSACPDMAYNCKIEALPSGLKTASSYNGLNEEVESWIKPDGASKWLVVQKKNYNNLGKVISKTVIGYRSKSGVSESDLVEDTSVTIGYKYDILGRLVETTLATGVRQEAVYEAGINRQIALSLPVDNKSLSFITVIDKNNAGKT
ncbi:MAG: hypothetical protein ACRY3E_05460, partial [Candidatus Lariskella arthropodorum]